MVAIYYNRVENTIQNWPQLFSQLKQTCGTPEKY